MCFCSKYYTLLPNSERILKIGLTELYPTTRGTFLDTVHNTPKYSAVVFLVVVVVIVVVIVILVVVAVTVVVAVIVVVVVVM